MSEAARPPQSRVDAIDAARALALLGMAAYHLTWDLAYFGLAPPGLPFSPGLHAFANGIACAFLALAGVSLALAHSRGLRWGGFFRRLGKIAAAAALVSAASLFAAPQAPIWFGILHCIAAASLMAAAVLKAPMGIGLLAGMAALAAPHEFASSTFDPPELSWLGLAIRQPATLDWRPLLPWAGCVWIALDVTRFALPRLATAASFRWRARIGPARGLVWLGRHSLAFYLMHQPVLFALLFAGTQLFALGAQHEKAAYLAACRPACIEAGGEIDACARACECVASKMVNAGLLARLFSRLRGEGEGPGVDASVRSCATDPR